MEKSRLHNNYKIRVLCFVLLLSMCIVSPVHAEETKTLKVAWFLQDGYQETTADGSPYGFHYEYLMNISQYTGWSYEFVPVSSFLDAYDMLKNGTVDIMGYLIQTPEREREVSFAEICCGYVSSSLFAREDSAFAERDYEAFDGMTVACMPTQNAIFLKERGKDYGFKPVLRYYSSSVEVEQAVQEGIVDAGLIAGYQPKEDTRIIDSFAPKSFYFAVKQSDSSLINELNEAMGELRIDNPFLEQELSYKYLPQVRDTLHLTQAEKRYIQYLPPIQVCYQDNWFPVSTYDNKTGNIKGIGMDMLKRVTEMTGLKFEYVRHTGTEHVPNSQLVVGVINGSTDTDTENDYQLTNSYLNVPLVLVKPHSTNNDIVPEKTAILYHLYNQFADSVVSETQVICYDTFEECLTAVLNGEVDQALINAYASEYLLKRSEYRSLQPTVLYNEAYDLCMGVEKNQDKRLLQIINKSLALISTADMSAMINKNISGAFEINLSSVFYYMPTDIMLILTLGLVLIVGLLTIMIFWQRRYSKKIQHMLYTDSLTGVLSKKGFEKQALERLDKSGSLKHYIIDLDINHFGDYNSIHGHQTGNILLGQLAKMLATYCSSTDVCARMQADRFILLLCAEDMESIKEKLFMMQYRFREFVNGGAFWLSFGIYQVENKESNMSVLCDRALIAKRAAKGNPQCFFNVYNSEIEKRSLENRNLLERFENALENDEFVHVFQPKYFVSGKLAGAEALVRWNSPTGRIMPGEFIELLEENGLICKLDLHMFQKLCEKIQVMKEEGLQLYPISINFSRAHLFDDEFGQKLEDIIRYYNISPSIIEIEITETTFATGKQAMTTTIDLLHKIGFLVSIDDFGSGYSSLNLIKDFPFDVIKLDREFINSVSDTDNGEKVIQNIINLAHDLEFVIVAEGVETEAQYQMLKRLKCDICQGYFFSRPVEVKEFFRILQTN